jgi:hypothetical protein
VEPANKGARSFKKAVERATKYNQMTFCVWEPITERVRDGSRL